MCNIVRLFGVMERLGALMLVPKMVLWLAFPSAETRAVVPNCYHPTALQLSVPHPQWVDMVLFPHQRDIMLRDPERYATDEKMTTFASNVMLEWPADMVDALVIDAAGDAWLSERFTEHAADMRNWRVGKADFGILSQTILGTSSLGVQVK